MILIKTSFTVWQEYHFEWLCHLKSIYIHFEIRVLSVFHSIGLAAPGNVKHQFPVRISLRGQCQLTTCTDIILHTHGLCLSISFSPPSADNNLVCDKFGTGSGALCMSISSDPRLQRTAVISSMTSFWSSEAEDGSSRSLVPQIQRIMAWSLQQSHCMSKVFGLHGLQEKYCLSRIKTSIVYMENGVCIESGPWMICMGNTFLNQNTTKHYSVNRVYNPYRN